ncbi:hypothetical protein QF046_002908 [Microbacterium sp. W4I4]|uniref:DUF2975 domain-containing protein n=1 Tax=Microbacterium sp. W4I4 TaxID=3042295 RepID=UPI0027815981|nr:DUF2975 domain-containing protein [Microbacterium sp. W4I4]MDQ0615267.1 hypothetical protein [Microbacterium sp. W4I4]
MKAQERAISKGDAGAMALFVAAGVVIAGWTIWHAVTRIIELAVGRDVRVAVEFIDAPAQAQLPSGSLPVQLDTASVTVDALGTMGAVPGIIGQVAFALTITGVVACLILLSRNLLRGRVFGKVNTRIVMTGGMIGLVGAAASRFFDNMLANAAMAQLTDGPTDTAVMSIEPFTFILAAFALSVIGTVFVVGARLQRETEGLV